LSRLRSHHTTAPCGQSTGDENSKARQGQFNIYRETFLGKTATRRDIKITESALNNYFKY